MGKTDQQEQPAVDGGDGSPTDDDGSLSHSLRQHSHRRLRLNRGEPNGWQRAMSDASSAMPASTMPIDRDLSQRVAVETPELVVLSYTIAGVGSRVYAGLIDLLVCIGLFLSLIFATAMLMARFGVRGSPDTVGAWFGAVLILGQFVIIWGYYVLCEGLADGRTVGKWRLGLRVVRDGGYSIGFGASATRNIMRAIDMQPVASYLFGITSIMLSKSGKRLGDLVAGTIVVQEQLVASPLARRPVKTTAEAAPIARLT